MLLQFELGAMSRPAPYKDVPFDLSPKNHVLEANKKVKKVVDVAALNFELRDNHQNFDQFKAVKPDIWEELTDLLENAQVINRKKPIPEELAKKIQQLIEAIHENNKPEDLIYLVSLLGKLNNFDTKKNINKTISILKLHYPKLDEYIKGLNHIIQPKGVEQILKVFESKYFWPQDQITLQNFETLAASIQELRSCEEYNQERAWIIYSSELEHLVPVYVKKQGNNLSFCITDSMGLNANSYWFESFKSGLLKNENEVVYIYNKQRQRDGYSCPIFSILDLRNILEGENSGRDIFTFISEDIHEDKRRKIFTTEVGAAIYTFELLPPEMMKITQSTAILEAYRKTASKNLARTISPVFTRISPTKEISFLFQSVTSVFDVIERNIFKNPEDYPLNKYVEKKGFTFLANMLCHI